MKNVPQILLRAYLRRNPVRFLRLSQWRFFSQYGWIKNILEELRPEFFPDIEEDDRPPFEWPQSDRILETEIHPLVGRKIEGDRGIYQLNTYLGQRGRGLLFSGTHLDAQRPVAIKVYRLPQPPFSPTDAKARQQGFTRQAGLGLADERGQDFRVVRPIEAIADPDLVERSYLNPVDTSNASDYGDPKKIAIEQQLRCFLVTEPHDLSNGEALDGQTEHTSQTLAQHLREDEQLSPDTVAMILEQVLQTLSLLHQQRYTFPSGYIQQGVIHGNLNVESLLWVTRQGQSFVYLTDLRLWERFFDPSPTPLDCVVTPESVQADLHDLGVVAVQLLTGLLHPFEPKAEDLKAHIDHRSQQSSSSWWCPSHPKLERFIQRLLGQTTVPFADAETAWQELVQMNRLRDRHPISDPTPIEVESLDSRQHRRWLVPLLSVMLLSVLGSLGWLLFLRPQSTARQATAPTTANFQDVSAVPKGQFSYTGIEGGSWHYVLNQQNVFARGQTLASALTVAQPNVSLSFKPVLISPEPVNVHTSLQSSPYQGQRDTTTFIEDSLGDYSSAQTPLDGIGEAIAQVQNGIADFAMLPLWPEVYALPPELDAQVVAYDGLAVFVAFSYAQRNLGLPTALKGEIHLEQLRQLYSDNVEWRDISRSKLPTKRYAPTHPEAAARLNAAVLPDNLPPSVSGLCALPLADIDCQPSLEMLRRVLRDFEGTGAGTVDNQPIGSVGVTAFSEMIGQCSVYPLALKQGEQDAVSPLVFNDGHPIQPDTDLCDRKEAYGPNIDAFRSGAYPLSYGIAVVFPRDNDRAMVGRKFAELLLTDEGQRLLREAGLVPVRSMTFE